MKIEESVFISDKLLLKNTLDSKNPKQSPGPVALISAHWFYLTDY